VIDESVDIFAFGDGKDSWAKIKTWQH
jgi:hypothetical protein